MIVVSLDVVIDVGCGLWLCVKFCGVAVLLSLQPCPASLRPQTSPRLASKLAQKPVFLNLLVVVGHDEHGGNTIGRFGHTFIERLPLCFSLYAHINNATCHLIACCLLPMNNHGSL
eukprot:scaffold1653_cov163-Skeletonema_dohrnii-CCMP3373.AAC.1